MSGPFASNGRAGWWYRLKKLERRDLCAPEKLFVRNTVGPGKPELFPASIHVALLYVFAVRRHGIAERAFCEGFFEERVGTLPTSTIFLNIVASENLSKLTESQAASRH